MDQVKEATPESWDAEYSRGWTEGLAMLQKDREAAFKWEGGAYRDMIEPSPFEMGKADVICEHWIARAM
jgi:hypothetical protein